MLHKIKKNAHPLRVGVFFACTAAVFYIAFIFQSLALHASSRHHRLCCYLASTINIALAR